MIFQNWVLGSLVWPKVVRSVHYCPNTKKTLERRYTDLTSLSAFPSSTVYPTKVIIQAAMYTLFAFGCMHVDCQLWYSTCIYNWELHV